MSVREKKRNAFSLSISLIMQIFFSYHCQMAANKQQFSSCGSTKLNTSWLFIYKSQFLFAYVVWACACESHRDSVTEIGRENCFDLFRLSSCLCFRPILSVRCKYFINIFGFVSMVMVMVCLCVYLCSCFKLMISFRMLFFCSFFFCLILAFSFRPLHAIASLFRIHFNQPFWFCKIISFYFRVCCRIP